MSFQLNTVSCLILLFNLFSIAQCAQWTHFTVEWWIYLYRPQNVLNYEWAYSARAMVVRKCLTFHIFVRYAENVQINFLFLFETTGEIFPFFHIQFHIIDKYNSHFFFPSFSLLLCFFAQPSQRWIFYSCQRYIT